MVIIHVHTCGVCVAKTNVSLYFYFGADCHRLLVHRPVKAPKDVGILRATASLVGNSLPMKVDQRKLYLEDRALDNCLRLTHTSTKKHTGHPIRNLLKSTDIL